MRRILLYLFISALSVTALAQPGKWTPGCYYLLDSSKVCGIIKWNIPTRNIFKSEGDHIQFKTADTTKKVKLSTNTLRSFVIKADSFVVSHDSDLTEYPVLMVALNNPLKLYVSLRENNTSMPMYGGTGVMMSVGYYSSSNTRYFYGKDPDNVTQLSRKKFLEVMTQIMADNGTLVQAIKNKEFRYGDMEDLIKKYQAGKSLAVQ